MFFSSYGYIKAVAALMIIALIFTVIAFFLNICGLSKSDIRRKYIYYKFATYLAILAVLMELTALIVFPACFYVKMTQYGSRRDWESFREIMSIFSVLMELTALIVFPACFYVKMTQYGSRRDWEVDWSYGLAWGATLFTFGASLLLICDKEHEEVYYKEKTIYNPPPELMN
ncbi:hypothetical protein DICVIV_12154 [Dictyocaulus viviparus]|uniref:Uncharacterized protein n=1 Tax=Dictyocaulus viviparus TaxID=29172 RepID=A0A0D8XB71_DICVI|nr:hypothetical protein DICVIV_12154 [Dictyocaulus viviparus]